MLKGVQEGELPPPFRQFLAESGIDSRVYADAHLVRRYFRIRDDSDEVKAQWKQGSDGSRVPWAPSFVACNWDVEANSIRGFKTGKVAGMDVASAAAVWALDLHEGEKVLDLCCAPGGKLALIAEEIGEKGLAVGVDKSVHRLDTCKSLISKYGIKNVQLYVGDGTSVMSSELLSTSPLLFNRKLYAKRGGDDKARLLFDGQVKAGKGAGKKRGRKRKSEVASLPNGGRDCAEGDESAETSAGTLYFDKVLVDAECTHDGSIRHIVKMRDEKWKDMDKLIENSKGIDKLQYDLLKNGFATLKVGGRLVYSTCSMSKMQNERVVERFLEEDGKGRAELVACPRLDECPCVKVEEPTSYKFTPSASRTSFLFVAIFVKIAE